MSRNMVPSSSRRSTNDGGREQSMGSSSSHPSTSNRGTGQRSAAGAAEPLIRRSWYQTSSSNQDKLNIQRAYQQQPMRPGAANVVTATERFSQMAISDHTARRTEPLHNRSKNEQTASATHKGDSSTSQKETGKADAHLSSGDLYDKECPICLEEYEPANAKIIFRCRHHYHFQCILQWMEKRITCPICNQALVVSFSR